MTQVLVDTNILLDIVTNDPTWYRWSSDQLEQASEAARAVINPLILAELSAHFDSPEQIERTFPPEQVRRVQVPWEAAFPTGQAFKAYRQRGGERTSPLPDFYIGAHAQIEGMRILTRDARIYRTYFSEVELIHPY